MAISSRRTIAVRILMIFLVLFIGAIVWYLGPALFIETVTDEEGNTTRSINLFPFGDSDDAGFVDFSSRDEADSVLLRGDVPRSRGDSERQPQLRLINEGPVIGATMFAAAEHGGVVGWATATTTDRNSANTIRYIELGTGHVYEGATHHGEIERISNTTIPKIVQAVFASPDRILIRYPDESGKVKTFSAELVNNFAQGAATRQRLQGIFLPEDIRTLAISPQGTLLSLLAREGGWSVYRSDLLGDKQVRVHDLLLSEWRLSWDGNEQEALLLSTPSYETFGTAYTLDTQSGALEPYITARKALGVVTTRDRTRALVSLRSEEETQLFVWNRENNQYIDVGLSTLAEKCVWAENRLRFYCAVPVGTVTGAEPDLWYQGVSHYSDEYWEIDPLSGRSRLVVIPIEYTELPIDTVDLRISPDEQFLYFRDKATRSLWSIQLDYEVVGNNQTFDTSERSGFIDLTAEEEDEVASEREAEFFEARESENSSEESVSESDTSLRQ